MLKEVTSEDMKSGRERGNTSNYESVLPLPLGALGEKEEACRCVMFVVVGVSNLHNSEHKNAPR